MIILRDVLNSLLLHSGSIGFEKYNNKFSIVSLDKPVSAAFDIDDTLLLPGWEINLTSTDHLCTRMELYYKPILPMKGDGGWMAKRFIRSISENTTDPIDNLDNPDVDGNGSDYYSMMLEHAQEVLQMDRPMRLYFPWLRDDKTAEYLLMLLIHWHTRQLYTLVVNCQMKAAEIEIGDKGDVTATGIVGFPYLSGLTWMVIGKRFSANIGSGSPTVQLELIQMGSSYSYSSDDWIDTPATGEEYIDKDNTLTTNHRIEVI